MINLRPIENQKLRARIYAIPKLAKLYPDNERFLRNGIVPDECKEDYEILENEAFQQMSKNKVDNTQPLSFVELCSFNNWYEIHPEKVAGKETLMTSRAFPVSIKGTKEDIINTIEKTINTPKKNPRARIAKAKAEAKLKLLKLLKI